MNLPGVNTQLGRQKHHKFTIFIANHSLKNRLESSGKHRHACKHSTPAPVI